MRLIDGGPDVVLLYPEVVTQDDDGNDVRTPSATPLAPLSVQLHRMKADDAAALGQQDTELWYFNTSTDLPAGAYAKAEARGRTWDVLGAPQRQGRSARTEHTHVVLRARGPVI